MARQSTNAPRNTFPATDFEKLVAKCHSLPLARENYRVEDYVENLFLTVLDFQMKVVTVERAIDYYHKHAKSTVLDYSSLKKLLAQYPDTKEGNRQVARYLWGYNHWKRVELLRRFLTYFETRGVTTQKRLEQWACTVDYEHDFKGKIKGAGFAIFKWLLIRQGIDTIKPDVWIHRFIKDTVGYSVSDQTAVEVLEQVAREMGIKAYRLDSQIWEYQHSPENAREFCSKKQKRN